MAFLDKTGAQYFAAKVKNLVPKKLENTSVPVSAWVTNSGGDSEQAYKASISVSGVTANNYAEVIFSRAQIEENIFDCFSDTAQNAVIIYASDKPSAEITIPTIIIT